MTNLSLKGRLWLLGIVVALGMSILASSAIVFTISTEAILVKFIDERMAMRHAATLAYANGLQKGQAIRNILLDPGKKTAYENFNKAREVFDREIDKLLPMLAADDATRAIGSQLRTNVDRWQPLQQQVIDQVVAGQQQESQSLLVDKETPAWRLVRDDLLEVGKLAETAAEQDRAELLAGMRQARQLAIGLGAVSLLVVAAIIVGVGRGIFRRVGGEPADAAAALTRIAQGDLTESLKVIPGDQQSIVAAMQTMQTQLRQLLAETTRCADAVVEESEAMRVDAGRLAQTADAQSSETSAIAAAVEQFTVSIGVMSESADDAGRQSKQSEAQANDSLGIAANAAQVIRQMADEMSTASSTMSELSQSVARITGIVNTIRDIADQTNLLALNAAIEAARAGEQGRGFAVVADEVRKLAELTTKSTEEIAQIVGNVRHANDVAVDTITRAKDQALEGAGRTEDIRTAVAQMVDLALRVSASVDNIALALREQSATSTDIAKRIELIAQGVEQAHTASTDSSRRSEALVGLSRTLKAVVLRFRV